MLTDYHYLYCHSKIHTWTKIINVELYTASRMKSYRTHLTSLSLYWIPVHTCRKEREVWKLFLFYQCSICKQFENCFFFINAAFVSVNSPSCHHHSSLSFMFSFRFLVNYLLTTLLDIIYVHSSSFLVKYLLFITLLDVIYVHSFSFLDNYLLTTLM